MKLLKSIAILAIAAISFAACSKSNDNKLDTTSYDAVIAEAQALASSATTADWSEEAIATLNASIATAKEAYALVKTQTELDNVVANMNAAIATFNDSKFQSVPASALTFECKFDGEATKTTGSNAWTLVPACGPATVFPTATYPTYVDGKVGKAVKLENGANFNITGFNPSSLAGKELSIAVWVNPSRVYANNYIVSFNRWSSWKLQLQDASKPFITVTGDSCVDADNETDNSCPANEWHHVAVCANFTAGTLNFYVDGKLTKSWTNKISGTIPTATDGNDYLTIGQQCSWETACQDDWFNPESVDENSWSSFWGLLDELKVYNTALTAGQVAKIYNDEK